MREIDVGRGTENGAAKFAAVFGLSKKNHRGPFALPPIRAPVKLVPFHRFLLILYHILTFSFGNCLAGGFHHILTFAKRFFFCMCFAKYLHLILNFRPDDGIGAKNLSSFSFDHFWLKKRKWHVNAHFFSFINLI